MDLEEQKTKNITPPQNFDELVGRLNFICGKNLTQLASFAKIPMPIDTLHGKGFTGELIEKCLGANAANQSIPDFPELGVELKTIPVDDELSPLESTFLCYAPLLDIRHFTFETSPLYSKITRVLFVLVRASRELDFDERVVLGYFFYSPDEKELGCIRNDFNELYELIKTGNVDKINARIGQVIQMRPKGANGKALTECIGHNGEIIKTRPRGFYMRRAFTKKLIQNYISKNKS